MKRGFYYALFGGIAALLLFITPFFELRGPGGGESMLFEIRSGDGFREVARRLDDAGLVRRKAAFEAYALLSGTARHIRPGTYLFSPSMSVREIAHDLRTGEGRDVAVTIPEGATLYDIDRLLAEHKVMEKGVFADFALREKLEGYLFPDTYRFYLRTDAQSVASRFEENFKAKASPILGTDPERARELLIAASILEKEVPGEVDRQKVMGLLSKRLREGMPLQVDASVCYAKRLASKGEPCYPVTRLDTQIVSPYNTYLKKGWPPGPIANPGISALRAAASPLETPYWYYLSDPVTKNTIFSKTLEEHEKNRKEYLL